MTSRRTVFTGTSLAALLAAGLLGGCATSATPEQDQAFGRSVRQALQLQTLNPDAGRESAVPAAVDAQAARNALVRQRESFKNPPPTFEVIGLTSGGAR